MIIRLLICLTLPGAIRGFEETQEERYAGAVKPDLHKRLEDFRKLSFDSDIPMMRKRFAYVRQRLNAMNRYFDQIGNHNAEVGTK